MRSARTHSDDTPQSAGVAIHAAVRVLFVLIKVGAVDAAPLCDVVIAAASLSTYLLLWSSGLSLTSKCIPLTILKVPLFLKARLSLSDHYPVHLYHCRFVCNDTYCQ